MRISWKAGFAAALAVFGSASALAQTWTITIGPKGAVTSTLQQGRVNLVTQNQATVIVDCQSGVECSGADLHLESNGATIADLGPPTQSAAGSTFTFPQSAVSTSARRIASAVLGPPPQAIASRSCSGSEEDGTAAPGRPAAMPRSPGAQGSDGPRRRGFAWKPSR